MLTAAEDPELRPGLTHTVYAPGFNASGWSDELREAKFEAVREASARAGMELIRIETNVNRVVGHGQFAMALAMGFQNQASKSLVTQRLAEGHLYPLAGGRTGLRRASNPGSGPLSLSRAGAVAVWLAVAGSIALVLGLASPHVGAAARVGLGLALGGAASNLGDRIIRGGVVDFIAIGRRPAFNVADAAMVAGVALVGVSVAL